MRSIFITNDDGIDAEGIIRLANTAKEFGDVWVVAPDGQRSAASHSISLREPVDVYPHDFPVEGVHAFSCIGFALHIAAAVLYVIDIFQGILIKI